MAITKGNSRPIKRESRPASPAERLPICQLAGDNNEDSTTTIQVQFLRAHFSMPIARAATVAGLLWGGARG